MNNDLKRKLMLWGGGIALAALFFGGSIRETAMRIMIMRQQQMKPSPVGPPAVPPGQKPAAAPLAAGNNQPGTTSPSDPNAPKEPPALDASFDRFVGVWEGYAPVAPNVCGMKLEIRHKDGDAAHLAGFPVVNCFQMAMPNVADRRAPQKMLSQISAMSAVLTGTPANGSIQFTVDKVIGKNAEGCGLTSFTVTPFGADQISAEWQNAPCQGGQLLLKKGRG